MPDRLPPSLAEIEELADHALVRIPHRLKRHLGRVVIRVEVILSTHDAGGLSALDIRLAQAIDEIAPERDRRPPLP